MIGQEKSRLEKTFIPSLRQDILAHLSWLSQRLEQLDRDLNDQIRKSPLWRDRDRLLQSIPGVGPTVSRAIMAQLPEVGTLSGKKAVALVGVAPYNRDSGRHMLYMAAVMMPQNTPRPRNDAFRASLA
jgi:transposase